MSSSSTNDPPQGYDGPPIGQVAAFEWPALVGVDMDAAVEHITTERPDLLLVQPVKEVRGDV